MSELLIFEEGQVFGEHLVFGKSTGEIAPVPAGKYFRHEDGTLALASEDQPGVFTPSCKDTYRLAHLPAKGTKDGQVTQKPIASGFRILVEYKPKWRTTITVYSDTKTFQTVKPGHWTHEQARSLWTKYPDSFTVVEKKKEAKSGGAT